jgi:large subunit ribosomal protein L20
MPRVKRGFKARRRRNKILKQARGFRGGRSKLFRTATESLDRALNFAYRDRKVRKREFRSLWIARINAGVRPLGMTYSKFMGGLKKADIQLDRKVLSDLAITDPAAFARIVDQAKAAA